MKLDRVLTAYRIGDPTGVFPIYDATGSAHSPGRWNTPSTPMIYASEHYSTAMLEKLVYSSGVMPANQHWISITIPSGIDYETVTKDTLPDWHNPNRIAAQQFGQQWVKDCRTAILIVPSVVARMERNILINPAHPDAKTITSSLPEPIWWDSRLFI